MLPSKNLPAHHLPVQFNSVPKTLMVVDTPQMTSQQKHLYSTPSPAALDRSAKFQSCPVLYVVFPPLSLSFSASCPFKIPCRIVLAIPEALEMSLVVRKRLFAYAKTKTQICFAVSAKLISAFFSLHSTIPLLPKYEISSR